MNRRILYFAFCAATLAALFPAYAQDADEPSPTRRTNQDETTSSEDKPSRSKSPLHVRYQSTSGRDRVAIGNVVRVKEGEVVHDLVVIGGGAVVDGKVTGDFVVVGGKAELGPHAEVSRDVVVVAGVIDAHP